MFNICIFKVDYDTTLFLDKNKDFIIPEQVMALNASNSDFFKKVVATSGATAADQKKSGTSSAGSGKSNSSLKFLSVTSQFKESLNNLMSTINSTNPHYIRCIKPNTLKKPNHFDNMMVLQQLRCGGVIEQLRISRSGFPGRLIYENFFKRYKLLAAKELAGDQKLLKDAKKGSEVLIQKLRINNDMVQFGLTKIFFKSGIVANLELIRGDLMKKSAIMIQKHWKGMLCKQRYRKQRDAALLLQTLLRSTAAKKVCSDIVEEQSTLLLQTVIRSVLAAMEFNETVRAATLLQTAMRSSVAGEELRELNKNAAAVVLQDYIKLYQQQNYFKTLLFATTAAQARWRGKLARREYRQLRIEARSLSNVVAEKNKLETKVEELQYRLKAEQKIKEKEQEKLKSDVKQLRLQLDEKNAKLSESAQQVQSMSLRIKQLEEELEESNRLVQQAATSQAVTSQSARLAVEPTLAPPLIKRTDDYDKQHQRSTSPVASEGAPTTPNPTPTPSETSENIFDVVSSDEEVDEDDNDSLSEIELSPQLSSSRQHQQQLPPPQIIKVTDEKLEQEVLILREKDHTNQLEIDQLNKKIAELKHQLEHAAAAAVSTNNSRQSLSSSTSNLNTPLSPTNDPTSVRSISYKDFDQSITKDASPPAPRSRSPSVTVNGIPDLIAALEINNNQVGAGRFLIDNIVLKENLGFVNGTLPEPGFIFTRCFLEEVLTIGNPVKLEMAYYFVDSVSLLTKDSQDNDLLCYWFSNISFLYCLVERSTPHIEPPNNHSRQSMEVLQIKTLLQNLVIKIYKTLVRNILDLIQPICHRVLNDTTSDVEIMEPLTNFLTKIFSLLQIYHVHEPVRHLLMSQIFQYFNSLLFNEIVLRRDLCCIRSSIHLKMNISELEYWAKNYGKDMSNHAIARLSQLKEAIYILMIDKTLLINADVRKEICPSISTAQIKQLLTMYSPDLDSVEEPIPLELLSALMSSDDYNKSENILLDLSNIFSLPLNNLHSATIDDLKKVNYTCDNLVSMLIKMNMDMTHSTKNVKK